MPGLNNLDRLRPASLSRRTCAMEGSYGSRFLKRGEQHPCFGGELSMAIAIKLGDKGFLARNATFSICDVSPSHP
jgi:hypothetical protein